MKSLSKLDEFAVNSFLITAKKLIHENKKQFVWYRELNINGKILTAKQLLYDIGIFHEKEIWNYILELNPAELIKIEMDRDSHRDYNSELFIFIKKINDKDVYIKLTINRKGLLCLSFHESYKGGNHE